MVFDSTQRAKSLLIARRSLLNTRVTEPVRRRIEQPTEEQARRSGCLIWGAVLGVLVGIMAGVYALPPILKHYYGETEVAADEAYRGDGKTVRLLDVTPAREPAGEASAGLSRAEFYAHIEVHSNEPWALKASDFTLEFRELEDWQKATGATVAGQPLVTIIEHHETTIEIHWVVEFPPDQIASLTLEALHLSDPRVRFELKPP